MHQKLTLALAILSSFSFGQDPNFNQVNLTNTYSNPALTGINGQHKITTFYRSQWPSLSVSQGTAFLSYQNGNSEIGNFGGYVMNTHYSNGFFNSTRMGLNYSKSFQLFEGMHITPGISAALINDRIDFNKVTFGDIANPRTGEWYDINTPLALEPSELSADFSAGLLLTYKNIFAGASFNHFGSIGLQSVFNIYSNVGMSISLLDNDLILIPELSYQYIQNFQRMELKLSSQYKWARLGFEYSIRDGISAIAGAKFKQFELMISSEMIISQLTNSSFNAYEFGLVYNFNSNVDKNSSKLYEYSLF